ncbi:MAG: hypothetical protein JWP97_4669 [Labilithrix sp.]|nr:hypothetical protein [Labilithrix sp.]
MNLDAPRPTNDALGSTLDEVSTTDLVREALDEAKELVRLEVQLAKADAREEILQVKRSGVLFGIAFGAALIGLALLGVALVLALGGTALVALAVAGGFLVLAGVLGYVGYGMLPKAPLEKTRSRLNNDVKQLKEHIA